MATADEKGTSKPSKDRRLGWADWLRLYLSDPRTAVLSFLGAALLIGGGRRVWQGIKARRAVAALGSPGVRPEEVEAAAEHGRDGIIELFRLLGTAEDPKVRDAAGRALAILWKRDDLIVEEEKALVRRGFAVTWKARRRYPRGLRVPIPIEASYGVPFLVDARKPVDAKKPVDDEFAGRFEAPRAGRGGWGWVRRASNGRIGSWERSGPTWRFPRRGSPGLDWPDLRSSRRTSPDLGPHRLALASKVRVVGLTDNWEIELPHLPFSFEFDPILAVEALLTTEDAPRAEAFARSIRLESRPRPARDTSTSTADLVLRDPPALVVTTPLPCDLAHRLLVEFEGVSGRFRAGIGGRLLNRRTRDWIGLGTRDLSGSRLDPIDRVACRCRSTAPASGGFASC